MNEIMKLEQELIELSAALPSIHSDVCRLAQDLETLKSGAPKSFKWIEISVPRTSIRKYECSNCGYVCTFQGIKCPKCQVSMR